MFRWFSFVPFVETAMSEHSARVNLNCQKRSEGQVGQRGNQRVPGMGGGTGMPPEPDSWHCDVVERELRESSEHSGFALSSVCALSDLAEKISESCLPSLPNGHNSPCLVELL